MASARITFTPSVAPFILKTFKMTVRKKDQVICYRGKPVPGIDGKPVTVKEFGGIIRGRKKGEKILVRMSLPGALELADYLEMQ